jgi:uncharacterized membrane protein
MLRQHGSIRRTFGVPLLYIGAALVAGLVLPRLDRAYLAFVDFDLTKEAAIAILTSIAAGTMALTPIVFSIALLMLQFSASAYSPRLLLWLARSASINHAIGLFAATFVYSLAAVAWVDRGGSGRVPPMTVWFAMLLLLASVAMFIWLIDRVGMLQVTRVLMFAGDQGRGAIERMYPRPAAAPTRPAAESAGSLLAEIGQAPVIEVLNHDGAPAVVQGLAIPPLVELAARSGGVIVMAAAVGDTVIDGMPILRVHGTGAPPPEAQLRKAVTLGPERAFEQDPKYALRILVDVAIKALSPAINDPTTAVQALDQIEDLLLRLGRRDLAVAEARDAEGRIRLLVAAPTWDDLVVLALDEIRFCGATSVQVMRRLRALLTDLGDHVAPERRAALRDYLARVDRGIRRDFADPDDQRDALQHDRQGLGLSRKKHPVSS